MRIFLNVQNIYALTCANKMVRQITLSERTENNHFAEKISWLGTAIVDEVSRDVSASRRCYVASVSEWLRWKQSHAVCRAENRACIVVLNRGCSTSRGFAVIHSQGVFQETTMSPPNFEQMEFTNI